jgi:hypothetical protein
MGSGQNRKTISNVMVLAVKWELHYKKESGPEKKDVTCTSKDEKG